MIKEHDCIVLLQDLPENSLKAGDIGTVVHIHKGRAGYEVEFMTLPDRTEYRNQSVAIMTKSLVGGLRVLSVML